MRTITNIMKSVFVWVILGLSLILGGCFVFILLAAERPLYVPLSEVVTPLPLYTPVVSENSLAPPKIEGIDWIKIPSGTFLMGDIDPIQFNDAPLHEVTLDTYWISKYPITNRQYQQYLIDVQFDPYQLPYGWNKDYNFPQFETGDMPVGGLSWTEAFAYAKWLDKQVADWTITIPSEAEWEKAARGDGEPRLYPWGNQVDSRKANVCGRECDNVWDESSSYSPERSIDDGFPRKSPVDAFPDGSSPYGVMDLIGNVQEWTRSKYVPYPYDQNDLFRNDLNDLDSIRVIRGTCYYACAFKPLSFRHAYRNTIFKTAGFRLVTYPPSE